MMISEKEHDEIVRVLEEAGYDVQEIVQTKRKIGKREDLKRLKLQIVSLSGRRAIIKPDEIATFYIGMVMATECIAEMKLDDFITAGIPHIENLGPIKDKNHESEVIDAT